MSQVRTVTRLRGAVFRRKRHLAVVAIVRRRGGGGNPSSRARARILKVTMAIPVGLLELTARVRVTRQRFDAGVAIQPSSRRSSASLYASAN